MRKTLILGCLAMTFALQAQTVEKTYFFDFGGQGSRGTITNQPGWNDIVTLAEADQSIAQFTTYPLVDSDDNGSDGYKLVLTTAWGANGNSGGGGLLAPDPQQLGDLAVATATCDYIFNTNNGESGRSFVITGLDTNKGYRFTIFGSRESTENRKGNYILSGANSWMTEMQVAGTGIGKNGENQRTGDAPISDIIFPDAAGNITLWIENTMNTYVPLSCMKMEQFSDAVKPALTGNVGRTFLLDFGSDVANRGVTTSDSGWNNILANSGNNCTAGTVFSNIKNSSDEETGVSLTINSQFVTNGLSGGGGFPAPDAAKLGKLAVESATYDYFFVDQAVASGSMTFKGLDPNKSYRFHTFSSRIATDARLGAFRYEGLNSWTGAAQAAGNALDKSNSQNDRVILVSEPIFPDANGEITLTMINGQKIYLPVNAMMIEELSGVERPDIKSILSAKLTGEGVEEGETTDLFNRGKNTFELYVKTAAGNYTVSATDDSGETFDLPVTLTEGVNLINVNYNTNEVEATPITYLCVQGSAVGGWSTTGQELTYAGNGTWNFKGELKGYDTNSDSGRVNFLINKDWSPTFKKVSGSKHDLTKDGGDDIPLNPGNYNITVDLNNMTFDFANGLDELDPYRITMMGSSVANGQGAAQDDNKINMGYAYSYDKHLAERYENGDSEHPFYISNISINGNSSVNLLNRFDDLEREYGKWVIYGISLGNEGIHEASDKDAVYNQWAENMQTLIAQARELGKEVIVMNNYTRGDFVDSDYEYVKKINDDIAFWDVPSVNLLGAIDNGKGNWADGYQDGTDVYHPNTAGHTEFFYAMVPSMMDAMIEGKTLTMKRDTEASYTLPAGSTVEFTPDGTVHSFTLALSAESKDGDLIATIPVEGSETPASLMKTDGNIVALLPDNTKLSVESSNGLDEIVLSQNYIRKMVSLTVNGKSAEETEFEAFSPKAVVVGHQDALNDMTLGELMFYRSSMHTSSPFTTDGQLNKSSLEVYYPFNGKGENLAMSTVEVSLKAPDGEEGEEGEEIEDPGTSGIENVDGNKATFRVRSEAPGSLTIFSLRPADVKVLNVAGRILYAGCVEGETVLNNLLPGIYVVNNAKILVK